MKRILPAIAMILLLAASCKKSGSGPETHTIKYVNTTFTPLTLTVNGSTSTIPAGQSITFTGNVGDSSTMFAQTSGLSASNTVVGSIVSWTGKYAFSYADSLTIRISVPTTYFYLMVNNQSSYSVTGVYVNYGLNAQTFDNISFGRGTYNIGYYPAYSNSNVRCVTSGTIYWQGNTTLTNTENQSVIFNLSN